jgi:hypothetical protein
VGTGSVLVKAFHDRLWQHDGCGLSQRTIFLCGDGGRVYGGPRKAGFDHAIAAH